MNNLISYTSNALNTSDIYPHLGEHILEAILLMAGHGFVLRQVLFNLFYPSAVDPFHTVQNCTR